MLVLLVLGVVMVNGHNIWVGDWRVLVTIVSWAVLLESVALILAPQLLGLYAAWSQETMTSWFRLGGSLWLLGGAVILYNSIWP